MCKPGASFYTMYFQIRGLHAVIITTYCKNFKYRQNIPNIFLNGIKYLVKTIPEWGEIFRTINFLLYKVR
jgi:hypothetical protein